MSTLRTFIVEDNPVIYDHLVTTLQELAPVEVIGHARDEAHARQWLQQGPAADLLIVDLFLLSGSGIGVLMAAQQAGLGGRRVVLTNHATPEIRRRCLELGAEQVFDKSRELEELFSYCARLATGTPDAGAGH